MSKYLTTHEAGGDLRGISPLRDREENSSPDEWETDADFVNTSTIEHSGTGNVESDQLFEPEAHNFDQKLTTKTQNQPKSLQQTVVKPSATPVSKKVDLFGRSEPNTLFGSDSSRDSSPSSISSEEPVISKPTPWSQPKKTVQPQNQTKTPPKHDQTVPIKPKAQTSANILFGDSDTSDSDDPLGATKPKSSPPRDEKAEDLLEKVRRARALSEGKSVTSPTTSPKDSPKAVAFVETRLDQTHDPADDSLFEISTTAIESDVPKLTAVTRPKRTITNPRRPQRSGSLRLTKKGATDAESLRSSKENPSENLDVALPPRSATIGGPQFRLPKPPTQSAPKKRSPFRPASPPASSKTKDENSHLVDWRSHLKKGKNAPSLVPAATSEVPKEEPKPEPTPKPKSPLLAQPVKDHVKEEKEEAAAVSPPVKQKKAATVFGSQARPKASSPPASQRMMKSAPKPSAPSQSQAGGRGMALADGIDPGCAALGGCQWIECPCCTKSFCLKCKRVKDAPLTTTPVPQPKPTPEQPIKTAPEPAKPEPEPKPKPTPVTQPIRQPFIHKDPIVTSPKPKPKPVSPVTTTPKPTPAVTTPAKAVEVPSASKTVSYADLTSHPAGCDPTKLETYLSDGEFETVFKMAKAAFYSLPKWKQMQKKKEVKLF